jgi:signal transduction histidine kinase
LGFDNHNPVRRGGPTKPTGEGTGLSIAWDIITQQHGGTISVDSQVGEFTEFTIRLPRAYGAAIAEAAA